jgi:hypothetical protein
LARASLSGDHTLWSTRFLYRGRKRVVHYEVDTRRTPQKGFSRDSSDREGTKVYLPGRFFVVLRYLGALLHALLGNGDHQT